MLNRKVSIDILRSFIAILIVIYHVLSSAVNNTQLINDEILLVIQKINSALEFHVPVFFMITGYLWLSDDKLCTYKNVLTNIKRFLWVLFTIGFVYAIMQNFYANKIISSELIINSLKDVLDGNLWDHMWFLYAIIGIYLFLPALKPFYVNSSLKEILLFVLLLFIFSIVKPILYLTGYKIPINFLASSSLFYVCLGGLIAKYDLRYSVWWIILFVFSFACLFIIEQFLPYSKVINSISAASIFAYVITKFNNIQSEYLRNFSDCTFGIYLFHPLFINIMIKVFHINLLNSYPIINCIIASISIIVISFIMTYVFRKNDLIKKYLL
ncbi:MAG: acyltransferase family protein [Phascolarctobacterium sp.]|nr:acyltransferase family protein [Phascolarctobacterium sp.]